MATVNVKPLGDRVLVQPLEEQEVKKGGIIIPDTAKEKRQEGKVVALGTGKVNEEGKKIDFTVKKGDKVLSSNMRTRMKIWAPSSCARSLPKRPTSQATARPRRRFSRNKFTAKVCATSLPERTRPRCSAAS